MDEKMDDKGDGAQRRKSLPAKLILKSKNAPNLCGKSKIQKAKCAICSKRNKTTLPYCNACHKFAERFKKRDISMVCDKKDHCPVGACESRSPGLDYCRSCRYRRITQLDHNFAKGHNSDQNDCGQKADDTRSGQEHSPEASSSNVNSVNHSNYVVRKCEICVNMNYTRRPYCQACRKFAERKKKGEKLPVCKKKSCSGNGVSGSLNYCRACRYREIMKLDRSFYNNTIIDESTESMNAGCDDSTSVNVAVNVEGNMPEQLMNSAPSGSGTNNGNKHFKTQTCRPSVITHHNNWPMGFQPESTLQSFNGRPYGPIPTNVASSGREIMPASALIDIFSGRNHYVASPLWHHNISSSLANGALNAGQSIPRQMLSPSSIAGLNLGQGLLQLPTVISTTPLAVSSSCIEKNVFKLTCLTEYKFRL